MKIYVVGNILVEKDSLPLKILPQLRRKFPAVDFVEIDPNENFHPPQDQHLVIVDSVIGIDRVTVFDNLQSFRKQRLVSPHGYDLYFHLLFLQKINKLPGKVTIIGIPA